MAAAVRIKTCRIRPSYLSKTRRADSSTIHSGGSGSSFSFAAACGEASANAVILTMRSGPILIFGIGPTSTCFDRSSFRALKVFHLQFLPPPAVGGGAVLSLGFRGLALALLEGAPKAIGLSAGLDDSGAVGDAVDLACSLQLSPPLLSFTSLRPKKNSSLTKVPSSRPRNCDWYIRCVRVFWFRYPILKR